MSAWGDGIDWNAEGRRAAAENQGPATGTELVIRALRLLPPPARVLDCGCNIGRFAPPFVEAGYSYVGVDQAEGAVELARLYNPGLDFRVGWLWEMAFEGEFDIAFCNAVLQHNTHDEKDRILPRIAAALKPGGLFMMQESTLLHRTATQLTHDEWVFLVERHGLSLLETWHPNREYAIHDAYAFRKVA